MNTVKEIAAAVIILLIGGLVASTAWYRAQYHNTQQVLELTQDQIKNQNAEAERELNRLTAERDELQAEKEKARLDQEKKDALAKADIDRLTDELRNRPVRVRIQCPGGKGGGGTAGKGTTSADNRAGDPATTYGVLPEANSGRLASALKEVEQLSAAYNSCRSQLIH